VAGVVGTIKHVVGTMEAQWGTNAPSTLSPSSLPKTLLTKFNHNAMQLLSFIAPKNIANKVQPQCYASIVDAKLSPNNSDSSVLNTLMNDNHSSKSIT
jgi:hypothetical protein